MSFCYEKTNFSVNSVSLNNESVIDVFVFCLPCCEKDRLGLREVFWFSF
jgi:hypothetical protein